jgi:hypothetical protein
MNEIYIKDFSELMRYLNANYETLNEDQISHLIASTLHVWIDSKPNNFEVLQSKLLLYLLTWEKQGIEKPLFLDIKT